jgi:hypothetical protein
MMENTMTYVRARGSNDLIGKNVAVLHGSIGERSEPTPLPLV